jgi:hypothetical protein
MQLPMKKNNITLLAGKITLLITLLADKSPIYITLQSIFKQNNLSLKFWSDPKGNRALLPKDEGQGVMISAFVSREFDFGMTLTPDQLYLINST